MIRFAGLQPPATASRSGTPERLDWIGSPGQCGSTDFTGGPPRQGSQNGHRNDSESRTHDRRLSGDVAPAGEGDPDPRPAGAACCMDGFLRVPGEVNFTSTDSGGGPESAGDHGA